MYGKIKDHLNKGLNEITEAKLLKTERIIASPQGAEIIVKHG